MQEYELVAESHLSKQRVTPTGPNITLNENTPIGRSATGPGNLPIDWAQVSGNHCRIFLASKDPPVYHLEDNSTNGTAINGTRVPKGSSRPLAEGDRIRLAVATQDPNKVIEYTFRRVIPDKVANNIANNAKRPLENATPGSDAKRAAKSAAAQAPEQKPVIQTDAALVQKLRQSNDELRQKVETERQATVEACKKARDFELLLKAERQSFQEELAQAKAAASDKGVKELAELKSKLSQAEAQAQRDAAACAEAREEAAQHKAAAEAAQQEAKQLSKEFNELAQSVHSVEAGHRAAQKALAAAEQTARQELQTKTEELQRANEEKAEAQRRAQDEAVARSAAEHREQELQRDMWEVKLKLQKAEDVCNAAEEKTLCLESFVREGMGNLGRASDKGTAQATLLTDLHAAAATITGILGKMQTQGAAAKDDMAAAKYNLDCALSVRDASPGNEPARPSASDYARLQGTQQPTQSTPDANGSGGGGAAPAAFRSHSGSLATQPRSPTANLPAPSPTLGPGIALAEPTQQKDGGSTAVPHGSLADAAAIVADSEAAAAAAHAAGDGSLDAAQGSSFVLNHLIGAQPRSSVNTPSFGNGSTLQQPTLGTAPGFAATEADPAGRAVQPEDADMQEEGLDGNDERENQPANGAVDAEKASAPAEKESSQRAAANSSVKPTLQLSLQGRDRYGVESNEDEFDDME